MRANTLLAVLALLAVAAVGAATHHAGVAAMVVALIAIATIGEREARAAVRDLSRGVESTHLPSEPGVSLVAIAYPDDLELLPALLRAASDGARGIAVLAISGGEPSRRTSLLPTDARRLLGDSPRLEDSLRRASSKSGRPLTFMSATGADPAETTLEVARRIGAAEVFTLCQDGDSAQEEARASRAWERLVAPKPSLKVHLLDAEKTRCHTFSLSPKEAPGDRPMEDRTFR